MLDIITVPGQRALKEWEKLRNEFPRTGVYPVLLGAPHEAAEVRKGWEERSHQEGRSPSHIVSDSLRIDVPAWFHSRLEKDAALPRRDLGEWPDEMPDHEVGIVSDREDIEGHFKKEVNIALLRVNAACEVFAALYWGGGKGCPTSEQHCAIHRYWQDRYLAEVVSVTGSVVECKVMRPPSDRETCMLLAREQSLYCSGFIPGHIETISHLASGLLTSHYWFFSWEKEPEGVSAASSSESAE